MSRSPIRRKSKKQAAKDREFDAVKPVVAERSMGVCEMRGPHCTRWADVYHHKAKRTHPAASLPMFVVHLCDPCHRYVHANPAWSYAEGWLIHYEEATIAADLIGGVS